MRPRSLAMLPVAALLASLTPVAPPAAVAATPAAVFLNEVNYDHPGSDGDAPGEVEFVEVAGPEGQDLTGWDVVLYNGSNGTAYDTDEIGGTIGASGVVSLSYAANGIQNGGPDGVALVDASDTVVQFLSYEGSFTATDGIAAGMTSTDVGVDDATPSGEPDASIQLTGTGEAADDFDWVRGTPSQDAVNDGQAFGPAPIAPAGIELTEIGRYTAPGAAFDDGGAEIVAFDPGTDQLFVVNGSEQTIDVLDATDPTSLALVEQVDLSAHGDGITSVAVGDGLVAAAVTPTDIQAETGSVVFIDPSDRTVVGEADAGHLPDAVTFTPDGSRVVVANEGEPSSDYAADPEGSVTIIDATTFASTQVSFGGLTAGDLDDSTRVFGPDASIAEDLEPEYPTVSDDGSTAWVTLQENNAIAEIDLDAGTVVEVFGLGTKDWTTAGAGLDASNRDDAINLRDWPVTGLPMPDAVASYEVDGQTYLVTANEGDARDYDTFSEEARVGDLTLCDGFSYDGMDAAELQADANLGRLHVTTTMGENAADGCFEELYAFGTRSFSIYDADGGLVHDSGSELEEITAELLGTDGFNANNDEPGFDSRSDDKGPEPEGVDLGTIDGHTYAFIGLERVGGIMAYDVTDPAAPTFVTYATSRDHTPGEGGSSIDLGPEGVAFVPADDSPIADTPLLVVSHEVSATTVVYRIDPSDEVGVGTCDPLPGALHLVSEVQGSGDDGSMVGEQVVVEGAVTGILPSYEGGRLFVQEEDTDTDGDPTTSEGVAVAIGANDLSGIAEGDVVRVRGTVTESFGQTTLTDAEVRACDDATAAITPTPLAFPLGTAEREATEGMLVTTGATTMTVTGLFSAYAYGELGLSATGVLVQPSEVHSPSSDPAAAADLAAENADNFLKVDDAGRAPDSHSAVPWYDEEGDGHRAGDTNDAPIVGLMTYSFGEYKLQYRDGEEPTFSGTTRPAAPELAGDERVAMFNVLNLFNGDGHGGGFPTARGASSVEAYQAQLDGIVQAILGMDAAVVGLIELENDYEDGADSSVAQLVDALEAEAPSQDWAWVDPADGTNPDADGDLGDDEIAVGIIYRADQATETGSPATFDIDELLEEDGAPTGKNRWPLAQSFEVDGQPVTMVVNHLKSKGSSCADVATSDAYAGPAPFDAGDDVETELTGNCELTRTYAMHRLLEWVDTDPTGVTAEAAGHVLVGGDLNAYAAEAPIDVLEDAGYTDLVQSLGDGAATYKFDGRYGRLDHLFAAPDLAADVVDADVWQINSPEPYAYLYDNGPDADGVYASSDHDPVLASFGEGGIDGFQLTVLHSNDGESRLVPDDTIGGVARFATIVDREQALGAADPDAGVVTISSGDNFLAGPQFAASLDRGVPFYDAIALDLMGYDVSAIGNHEFDFGPEVLADFIEGFGGGTTFVSANLDVSGVPSLQALADAGTIVGRTQLDVAGRQVGIVGATTPALRTISSPGDVGVGQDVVDAVQGQVDAFPADVEIVILTSHLQDIDADRALVAQLSGVDVAIAGGGDELLANADDPLLAGTGPDDVVGSYPLTQQDRLGEDVQIVTTAGNYGYLGKLVVTFDADGEVAAVGEDSGPIANPAPGTASTADVAEPDPQVQAQVVDPVQDHVQGLQDHVVATSEVDLDGRRAAVRTVETNQGNLVADALLDAGQDRAAMFGVDTPQIAIQNGGGIRNDSTIPAGPLTEFDTFAIAPFANFVSVTEDVPSEVVEQLFERAYSAAPDQGGQFAQVAGMTVVYDPTAEAQVIANDGTITTPGERIVSITLDDGQAVVVDGEPVAGVTVDIATNNFTAAGGDNYPFGAYADDFVPLDITYQQALLSYVTEDLGGTITAAAYPEGGQGRITTGQVDPGDPSDPGEPEDVDTADVDGDGPVTLRVAGVTVQVAFTGVSGSGRVTLRVLDGADSPRGITIGGTVVDLTAEEFTFETATFTLPTDGVGGEPACFRLRGDSADDVTGAATDGGVSSADDVTGAATNGEVSCVVDAFSTFAVGTYDLARLSGADRYETAARISRETFPDGAEVAYVARGDVFADALAAGPVAGLGGAPILLTERDRLDGHAAEELVRLDVDQIVVLGGTVAISEEVEAALDAIAPTRRVSGADRYATAAAVSADAFPSGVDVVHVATGENFPDALVGGVAAARDGAPVLLTRRDGIPDALADELDRLRPGRIVVLGGTVAVSDAVVTALQDHTTGTVTRISGADRFETAARIADTFDAPVDQALVSTGHAFADALTGVPAAFLADAPIVLTERDVLPDASAAVLGELLPDEITVLGGSVAVAGAVTALRAVLRGTA